MKVINGTQEKVTFNPTDMVGICRSKISRILQGKTGHVTTRFE